MNNSLLGGVAGEKTWVDRWVLWAILAFHVLLYGLAQPIAFGSDDLSYAMSARQLQTGSFHFLAHHFSHRVGVFAPTALFYSLFGANIYTTTALALLSSLLTIAAVFQVTFRLYGRFAAILAGLFLAGNTFQIQQALYLGPDVVVSMCGFVGIAILAFARNAPNNTNIPSVLASWMVVVVFTYGVLVKESMVWIFMFVSVIMVLDLARGRHVRLWGWFCGLGAVSAGLYLGSYQFIAGDPLYRLQVIERVVNDTSGYWVYFDNIPKLIARLTYEPLIMILKTSGYVTLLFLGLPMLFVRPVTLFGGMVVFVLLSFWFATSSFKFYNPIGLYDRHILFILAPLSVMAGGLWAMVIGEERHRKLVGALLLVCFVLIVALRELGFLKRELLLLSLPLLLLFARPWWPQRVNMPRVVAGVLVAVAITIPLLSIWKGPLQVPAFQPAQEALVRGPLSTITEPTRLYVDHRMVNIISFRFNFQLPNTLTLVNWQQLPGHPPNPVRERQWVLITPRYLDLPALLPLVQHPPKEWRLLWRSPVAGEELYLYEAEGLEQFFATLS